MSRGQNSSRSNSALRRICGTSFASLRKQVCEFTKKEQVDLANGVIWIPDSKTPNGVSELPLTRLASDAFRSQMNLSGNGNFLFPSDQTPTHLKSLKTAWRKTLRRASIPYFRIYDLRSTYATRLSAGGVADEWVTQMLRQGDS